MLLDFDAFDWLEEEEVIRGHPRDPFHRDRRPPQLAARADRARRRGPGRERAAAAGVRDQARRPRTTSRARTSAWTGCEPSPTRSICAYKGNASYFTLELDGRTVTDIAWTYEQPLPDAAELTGYICFFDERVDVILDGERRERPRTPWSEAE